MRTRTVANGISSAVTNCRGNRNWSRVQLKRRGFERWVLSLGSCDCDLADVFVIQTEIADQLQAKLSPNEKAAIEQAPTADLIANALQVHVMPCDFVNSVESGLGQKRWRSWVFDHLDVHAGPSAHSVG
jgi:hypothetical protein